MLWSASLYSLPLGSSSPSFRRAFWGFKLLGWCLNKCFNSSGRWSWACRIVGLDFFGDLTDWQVFPHPYLMASIEWFTAWPNHFFPQWHLSETTAACAVVKSFLSLSLQCRMSYFGACSTSILNMLATRWWITTVAGIAGSCQGLFPGSRYI